MTTICRSDELTVPPLEGCCLGFYLADLPRPTEPVKRICYGDDITVWASEFKFSELEHMINGYLTEMSCFLQDNSLLISAPKSGIGSKRHSLQAVELSQRTQAAVQIVSNLPAPSNGVRFTVFWAWRPCGPAGWLALLLTPGPITLNKKVWICDICHKQIHVRKQISTRCNRIQHRVHLGCAGIRQAQYTDTWTFHLHREFILTQT